MSLLLASCATPPPPASPSPPPAPRPAAWPPLPPTRDAAFEAWRLRNRGELAGLEAHLQQQGLHAVLPLPQLLRSASSWDRCGAEPYSVPPQAQWPAVSAVLRLLQELRAQGVIGEIEVHSGYRAPPLNTCAGGAARSAHALAFALDFSATGPADAMGALCAFWLIRGHEFDMGLGQYPSGRIHIDTAGYRSWGADGTRRTARCGAG